MKFAQFIDEDGLRIAINPRLVERVHKSLNRKMITKIMFIDCDLYVKSNFDDTITTLNEALESNPVAPGDPICSVTCPICGGSLDITHGGDENEIAVYGTPKE